MSRDESNPDELSQVTSLAWGFVPFQVIVCALRARLFDELGEGLILSDLARRMGWRPRPLEKMLSVLAQCKLLTVEDVFVKNTPFCSVWLVSTSPNYIGDYFIRNAQLLEAYTRLDQLLLRDEPDDEFGAHVQSSFGLGKTSSPDAVLEFARPMHAVSLHIFSSLVDALPSLAHVRSVLDIGGGLGAFAEVLRSRGFTGDATILETPAVATVARSQAQVVENKVNVQEQNWHVWEPTEQYELVMLAHVLHEEKFEDAEMLLKKASQAVAKEGSLVVVGFSDASMVGDIFALNLLLEMGSDMPTRSWLHSVLPTLGLVVQREIELPGGRVAFHAKKQ